MKKKILITLALLVFCANSTAQQLSYLLTDSYSSDESGGISIFQFNSADGSASAVSKARVSNSTFVAVSPDERFVYSVEQGSVNNGNGGKITAFSFDKKTGTLKFLNSKSSGGINPCYVNVDKTGKWVVVGNYDSGSLSVFPVNINGSLGAATTIIKHEGSGPNKSRQASPHVHGTFFSADNRFLLVPDLGIDKVMIYGFDEIRGKLTAANQPFAASEPGSGPRHLGFNPTYTFAYLIEELSGTVVTYKYRNGSLKRIQRISSMPDGYIGFPGSADIHASPDGKFLYASNRAKSDTIAIFIINQLNGKLTLVGHQSTLGKTPRNFNFDPSGNYLLVANQNSENIVVFKIDKVTGLLTDTGNRINVGKPVCIKWISKL